MELENEQGEEDERRLHNQRSVIIAIVAGFGALTAAFLLMFIIPCLKAYKSFLQRLVIVMVFSMMFEDCCRATAIIFHVTNTTGMAYGCTALGFVTVMFHWYTYMICLMWVIYLLVIVCIQTRRDNTTIGTKFKASKILRASLELGIFTGVLVSPVVLFLWIPFYARESTYGYNGYICTIKSTSNSTMNSINADLFISGPILVTGLFIVLLFIGMAILHCIMSAKLKHAKQAIGNLVIFSFFLIAFFAVFIFLAQILKLSGISGYPSLILYGLYVILATLGKFIIVIGYLIAFHCTKRKKRAKAKLKWKVTAEYGTFKESTRQTAPSSTYFTIPYTGQFETSMEN